MKSIILPSSSFCSLFIFSFSLIILLETLCLYIFWNKNGKLPFFFIHQLHFCLNILLSFSYLGKQKLLDICNQKDLITSTPPVTFSRLTWKEPERSTVNLLLSLFPLLKSHFSHQLLWTVALKETHGLNLQVLDFFVRPIELWIIRIELNRIELNLSVWGGTTRIKKPRHGSGFSKWCVLSCWCFLWADEPE